MRAAVLFGGLVAGLVGAELAARAELGSELDGELPGWHVEDPDTVVMTGHATRLWGMTPGVKDNAGAQATIGGLGMRGVAPAVPRPEERQRVLVLGDSSFFGHGVEDDETLTSQLVRVLAERGIEADAVNAAVPGYSLAQSVLLMDELGWDTEPTLVVSANLWSDNTWDAFHDEDLLRSRRLAQGNPLVHSAAFRWLVGRAVGTEGGRLVSVRPSEGWPADKVRRVPPRRFGELLDGLVREAAERGVGAALLAPTNRFLVDTPDGLGAPAWGVYFEAQRRVAAHHGIPVADMTPPFVAAFEQGTGIDTLFSDMMHPRAVGQRLMAEALVDALVAAGWPANDLVGRTDAADLGELRDDEATPRIDDGGVGSPQRNLFSGAGSSRTEEQVADCEPWSVVGEVAAREAVEVQVADPAGRSLGRAQLPTGGPFTIDVCTSLEELVVSAHSAGVSDRTSVTRGASARLAPGGSP